MYIFTTCKCPSNILFLNDSSLIRNLTVAKGTQNFLRLSKTFWDMSFSVHDQMAIPAPHHNKGREQTVNRTAPQWDSIGRAIPTSGELCPWQKPDLEIECKEMRRVCSEKHLWKNHVHMLSSWAIDFMQNWKARNARLACLQRSDAVGRLSFHICFNSVLSSFPNYVFF